MFGQGRRFHTIETPRLVLKPVSPEDVPALVSGIGNYDVVRWLGRVPYPSRAADAEAFVARGLASDRAEDVWVMDGAAHGLSEVLGLVGLERMDREQSEVGYWVAPALWNTGLASEAVQAVVAANPHRSKTLFAEVFQDNPASAHVLTNAGFDYIGDAEAFSVARNAKVPTWTYIRKMA